MCILSLVRTTNSIVLTSNRDEQRARPNSLPPEIISSNNRKSILARDAQAQGTWLLTDNAGRTAVLLNGAFEYHTPAPPYRESRGVILMNLFQEDNFKSAFLFYNLENIEPFQVVYLDQAQSFQCVWDGIQKHVFQIDLSKPSVFFSPTLYQREQQDLKKNHFLKSLEKANSIDAETLFEFHTSQNTEHSDLNFFMNRENQTTKSVSQIELHATLSHYRHWQAWDNQRHDLTLPHVAAI
jgi:hypothetical protein